MEGWKAWIYLFLVCKFWVTVCSSYPIHDPPYICTSGTSGQPVQFWNSRPRGATSWLERTSILKFVEYKTGDDGWRWGWYYRNFRLFFRKYQYCTLLDQNPKPTRSCLCIYVKQGQLELHRVGSVGTIHPSEEFIIDLFFLPNQWLSAILWFFDKQIIYQRWGWLEGAVTLILRKIRM